MDNMIQVTGGTTTSYVSKIIPSSTLVSDFMSENNMSTTGATIQFNGAPINDFSKSFADLGVTDACTLFAVVNAKNA